MRSSDNEKSQKRKRKDTRMGAYTNYAEVGARAWDRRRMSRCANVRENDEAPSASVMVAAAAENLQCPRCEETFSLGQTCPRCDVTLVDRNKTLIVPKRRGTPKARRSRSFNVAMVLAVLAFVLPCIGLAGGAIDIGSNGGLFGLGAVAVLFAITSCEQAFGERPRNDARSIALARWAQRSTLEVTPTDDLPVGTDAVRVRGTLRVTMDGETMRAWVEGDEGVIRLPISEKLLVRSQETLDEVEAITAGEEIEVVGPVRCDERKDYRETGSVFTFEEGAMLDVWV